MQKRAHQLRPRISAAFNQNAPHIFFGEVRIPDKIRSLLNRFHHYPLRCLLDWGRRFCRRLLGIGRSGEPRDRH
ncbi:MAG TPA: hypothetical protein VII92_16570, partial [Anaerolineae bacterium]